MKWIKLFEEFRYEQMNQKSLPSVDEIVIRDIQVIRGKNRWSETRTQLIQMVLDLGDWEEFPSDKIPFFSERLKEFLPSLWVHRCSIGIEGGFFQRVDDGTWLGHIIEHIALEIQTLAGMDVGWGRTRGVTGEVGVYNVVFNYLDEEVGVKAAKESVRIAKDLINGIDPKIEETVLKLRTLST